MSKLVSPHGGGSLRPLLLPRTERADEIKRAERLAKIHLSSREVSDLFMLAMGAYTPLDGFMGEEDWRRCCTDMVTGNGIFWPIPITLSCDEDLANSIAIGEEVALVDAASGEILAVQTVTEKYTIDRALECREVYSTTDTAHPGVQKVMEQPAVNLAGPVMAMQTAGLRSPRSRPGIPCIAAMNIWPRSPSKFATACSSTRCLAP
jgi:sulfate adenylyltransferase